MAEYHFRRALSINAVSSVLRCYLSMSLHAQNDDIKSSEALDILIQACKVDPKNPQVMKCPQKLSFIYLFIYLFINLKEVLSFKILPSIYHCFTIFY